MTHRLRLAWPVALLACAILSLVASAIPKAQPTAPAGASTTAPAALRPNIVYILADDLGYGDVSAFDPHSKIQTPSFDAVVRAGMRFTDAHSNSAVCTPTRYGILTGRYCWRSLLKRGVLDGYDAPLIDPGRMTVASMLRDEGYSTGCVGKWHLGLGWQLKAGASGKPSASTVDFTKPLSAGPQTVGFDYSYIIPASLDMDPYVYIEDGRVTEQPTKQFASSPRPAYYRGGPAAPDFTHEGAVPELTKRAEAFIDRSAVRATTHVHGPRDGAATGASATNGGDAGAGATARRPFFLYFALPSPHTPHVPAPEFRGKSGAGNYGDYVVETDWAIGRILDALHRNGLDDNTLVIVTSDNGAHSEPLHLEEQFDHHANSIFRGQKSDAWDGGHHIPFAARWPGHIPAGARCDQTICLTDLMATCAAITGATLPNNAAEDSYNILPLLTGQTSEPIRPATILHSMDGYFVVRKGPWKLLLCRGSGGWSLKEKNAPADAPPVQLYNVQTDPSEEHNVYAEHADLVEEMKTVLEKYQKEGRSTPERR